MTSFFDNQDENKQNPLIELQNSLQQIYQQLERASKSGLNNPAIEDAVVKLENLMQSIESIISKDNVKSNVTKTDATNDVANEPKNNTMEPKL